MAQPPTHPPASDGRGADAEIATGGLEAAFGALVQARYSMLCQFAYRFVRSRTEAEDVVQEVLGHFWQRVDRVDFEDPLPLLYQAVRNRAISHLRGERARERRQALATTGDRTTAPPDANVEADELTRAIQEAVDALPERCRLIFVMSREQRLSYAEIARVLGISVKTVETQMGRALRTLRHRLAPFVSAGVAVALVGWSGRLLP